jgi:hypothetical protein
MTELKGRWRPEPDMPRSGQPFLIRRGGRIMRWLPYKARSAEYLAGIGGRWQIWLHDIWMNCRFEPKGEWRYVQAPKRQPECAFGSRPAPGLMPTGETPEEWKARHNAVIDRCVKFGKRETVRVRVKKSPHPDQMR